MCPIEFLVWHDENNNELVLNCFDEEGESKGLFEICKELKLIPLNSKSANVSLNELYEKAKTHPAFEMESNLAKLGDEYGVKVIFLPKFHCELSPIEGIWAFEKQYIRKRTDQTFPTLRRLLNESRNELHTHYLIPKLWRRFWRTLNDYKDGKNFIEILNDNFGANMKKDIKGHRYIYEPYNSSKNF